MLSEHLIHLLMAMDFGHIQCSRIVLERMTNTIQHCNTLNRTLYGTHFIFQESIGSSFEQQVSGGHISLLSSKEQRRPASLLQEEGGTDRVYTYAEHSLKDSFSTPHTLNHVMERGIESIMAFYTQTSINCLQII